MKTAAVVVALLAAAAGPLPAARSEKAGKPDFTQGDSIPEGADHDWTLGATGARGWIYSHRMSTRDARQIYITKVHEKSPADGVLKVGDVILGVGGERFSSDPRTEFGKALTRAESEAGGGKLPLIRWRDGRTETVVLKLPVLGSYSPTAPYDCPKSRRILEQGCEALAERMAEPSYRANPIVRSLNAMALLAGGNPKHLPIVKKEAQWASKFKPGGYKTWWYGYTTMFLAEYVLVTGDESVLPGLRRLAMEAANGQSIVGSWGHGFALPDGRLGGYGMMNSPGVPLTISLVMARAAGVKDHAVQRAVERSANLLRFYIGKGSVPYGDHRPWTQTHADNGKNGMAAVLFDLMREQRGAEFFSRMSTAAYGSERDTGHTGNFFNILWAIPSISRSGPHATGAWMEEFGAWYFDLARRWDGTYIHQGPPQNRHDKYHNWDCTGAYLLAYAMPLKNIRLTGKRPSAAPQLDAAAAQELIADGRGWNTVDRSSAYDKFTEARLLQRLGSWSPIVRGRAAKALGRRDDAPLPALLKMLESPDVETRIGACQALAELKHKAAPAVDALRKQLDHENLWLRIKAAEALAVIGEPAMVAVPQLLEMLARGPTEQDPRNMQQRYLCFAVFGDMLKNSLEGVDRDRLRKAVRAGLRNQDGRARGAIGNVYQQLSYEEIKPLLTAIHEAVVERAPSGIMFADGIRLAGLELLARHRIREGIPLCIDIMDINRWGKRYRIRRCLKILQRYGGAARSMIPKLKDLEKRLKNHREAKGLKSHIELVNETIDKIKADKNPPELRSIND